MRTCSSRCSPRAFAAAASLLAFAFAAPPVRAQTQAPSNAASASAPPSASASAPGQSLERVVVTGSQIPRIDAETAFPVQIIRREEIERSGVLNVEDLVSRITANYSGGVVAVGQNNNHPNFSGLSLRGFGTTATLVLLNGRRLANHAFSDESGIGVDLNAIPLAAIERVEVLKDGASAIYGSDAIAGVVNFILREDFQGIEASIEQGHAQQGGGGSRHETLTLGAGSVRADGYNVFVVIDHVQQHAQHAIDRPYSATGYQPALGLANLSRFSFPANIATPDGLVNPAAPACGGFTVQVGNACKYDSVRQTDVLPPDRTLGGLARGVIRLPGDSQAYVELIGSRHTTLFNTAPSPADPFDLPGSPPWVVPVNSPFYPTGLGLTGDIVNPLFRAVSLGQRSEQVRTDQFRAVIGWKGVLAGWDVDAALLQSTTRSTLSYISGFLGTDTLNSAFASGLVNPFGDSGPAGDALLAAAQVVGPARTGRGVTRTLDLRASRDLAQWDAGPLTLGIGAEARRETLVDETTAAGFAVLGGQFSAPKSGSRTAQAFYAELAVPIVRKLDAQLAVRTDHYSDFGTSTNPKVGLRWQPTAPLVLRASAGTGFRAPSLPELFTTQLRGPAPVDGSDPLRCPVTMLDSDCAPEVPILFGGNPALGPERSRQWSAGLVFSPVREALLALDWWRIDLQRTIAELPDAIVLDGDPRFEGRNIVRGPVDPAFPALPGAITELIEVNENVGRRTASGIDVDLRLRSAMTRYGRWSADLSGSYLAHWSIAYDGIHPQSFAGTGALPRWQQVLTLGWDARPWAATLAQQWRSGYTDEHPDGDGNSRRVAPYRVWNGQVAYGSPGAWQLVLGVKNLLNSDPPFSNQTDYFQVGYDPSYADPHGRFWYARATYRWR